jgi:hypothetical protein
VGDVIPFPAKDETTTIDLVTILDVAIRDLRDIVKHCRGETRDQAEACLRMLKAAHREALTSSD